MSTKQDLIEKYKKETQIIDKCLDDIERNIRLTKKEEVISKDVLFDMEKTRSVFLSEIRCYKIFIKELENLKFL